jgi:DNA (cytosine-5)-methyltransferase 1
VNYIDLFHGIGGFALGAVWAGVKFENHFCSDIEPYCQRLYALRFPDSIQLGDITKIDTEKLKREYPGEWLLSGGFPCQDISIAGKGAGITGARSGLWFEYWRLIRDLRPMFAIIENVGQLVHRGLREIITSLAQIGYSAEWIDICASDMDLQTERQRIFIVAHTLCGDKKMGRDISRSWREWKQTTRNIPRLDVHKPGFLGKPSWIPNRMDRLRGIGNSIVPQIAELLFRQIKPYLIKGE